MGLDAKTRAMIEEELGKRKAQDMAFSFDFVQREGGHVAHAIRTCPLLGVPPERWVTKCGWRFGLTRHFLHKSCERTLRCGSCFKTTEEEGHD